MTVPPDDVDAQAIADELDERDSEAAIEAQQQAHDLTAADEPAETAEQTAERDEQQTDVEMADIEYEAAPDIPGDAPADTTDTQA